MHASRFSDSNRPSDLSAFQAQKHELFLFRWIMVITVVFYSTATFDYLFRSKIIPVPPVQFYYATIALAAIIVLLRPTQTLRKIPAVIIAWLWVFFCYLALAYFNSLQSANSLQALIFGWQATALLASFLVIASVDQDGKLLEKSILLAISAAIAFTIYDFFSPTFSPLAGRAAGFYVNPNRAGSLISLAMVVACGAIPRKMRLAFCVLAGAAVLVTFSRSSWILWATGVVGLAGTGVLIRNLKFTAALAIGSLAIGIVLALLTGGAFELINENFGSFLSDDSVSRIGGTGTAFGDASARSRLDLMWSGLETFAASPWVGVGLGGTEDWVADKRPHNMYLLIAIEGGIVGLAIYLGLVFAIWLSVNPTGKVAVMVFAVSGFFSHNLLEQPEILCLVAVVIIVYRKSQMTNQFLS